MMLSIMATRLLSVLLVALCLVNVQGASAAVHGHNVDNDERESDGSFRPRDHDHYNDGSHRSEFDHEAILGSVKEAEEFDKLSPEEARRRLAELLPQMDLNKDEFIDRDELKKWILNSFINLSKEEAQERMAETDTNRDAVVSWPEYVQDAFGVHSEDEIGPEEMGDTGMLLHEEKAMWAAADLDGDGNLNAAEFAVFANPEEHESMHPYLINQTMREKDTNKDGLIDFNEYVGERGSQQDKSWMLSERDRFEHELDLNGDGILDTAEIKAWVIPDNEDIADEEVEHLISSADDDSDGRLSVQEVLDHHDIFVGSDATDYGNHLMKDHFDDEL